MQAQAPILDGYEIFSSFGLSKTGGGVGVLFREVQAIFLDSYNGLLALDMNDNGGRAFKLVTVYASTGVGNPFSFRRLETFLRMSHALVLMEGWNSILDARKNCLNLVEMEEAGAKTSKIFDNLLINFQ